MQYFLVCCVILSDLQLINIKLPVQTSLYRKVYEKTQRGYLYDVYGYFLPLGQKQNKYNIKKTPSSKNIQKIELGRKIFSLRKIQLTAIMTPS